MEGGEGVSFPSKDKNSERFIVRAAKGNLLFFSSVFFLFSSSFPIKTKQTDKKGFLLVGKEHRFIGERENKSYSVGLKQVFGN